MKYMLGNYAYYFKTNLKHLAYESILQAGTHYLL